MEIRKTLSQDIDAVMECYAEARAYMHSHGNPHQWVNGYPRRELIEREAARGCSYVCMDGETVAAVFSLIEDGEPTYQIIHDGAWLDEAPYGVVHRICVARHGAGVGAFCLDWCLTRCGNIRIDTHRDNLAMQALLKKCGFQYCGWINLADGSERLAFQKRR